MIDVICFIADVVLIGTRGIGRTRMRIQNPMSSSIIGSGKYCGRRNSQNWALTTANRGRTPDGLASSPGHRLASEEMNCCIPPPVEDSDRRGGLANAVGVVMVIGAWVIVIVEQKGIVAIDMISSRGRIVRGMTGNGSGSVIGIEIVIMISMDRKVIGTAELMAADIVLREL